MKPVRVVVIFVIVLCLILLVGPYLSYATMKAQGEEVRKVTVSVKVFASAPASGCRMDREFSSEGMGSFGYLDYIGYFWGQIFAPGSTVPPDTSPYVGILVYGQVLNTGTGDYVYESDPSHEEYGVYAWGLSMTYSVSFYADVGDMFKVYTRLYVADAVDYAGYSYFEVLED